MYICDMCNNPIEIGTQYVNVFGKIVCLDCAVRNTLDDVIASFGIMYMEAPDDIIVSATVDGQVIDATPEQVENFFRSENPVSAPTQVGEEKMTDEEDDDPNAIHEKNGWYYPGTDSRDEEMSDKEGD